MRRIATLIFIVVTSWVYGQQDIQFTQFMQNRFYYNPGVTGSSGSICLLGTHRSQWVGFENAPTTQNFSAEVPLEVLHGGVGLQFTADKIGYFQDMNLGLTYAYQHELGNGGKVGIGLQFDIRNKSVSGDAAWLFPDGTLGALDPSIPKPGASSTDFDLNFGIYYQDDKWWGGISSARMIEATASFDNLQQGSAEIFKNKRSYLLMGGYNYALENSNIILMPALLLKTDFAASPSADIHIGASYNKKIWGGVTYRLQDALGLMAGYYITPDFKISYSYDITLSELSKVSGGSHEILVGYCFRIEIPEKIPGFERDPRFL